MACNSNSNSGIGIEVNSNSNSGIDPSPGFGCEKQSSDHDILTPNPDVNNDAIVVADKT